MRISDWSSDVCSSDLTEQARFGGWQRIAAKSKSIQIRHDVRQPRRRHIIEMLERGKRHVLARTIACRHRVQSDPRFGKGLQRSEEHTSELQSLMRISYAVFCLKKKKRQHITPSNYS